jgi:hypothetical protein
VANKNNSRPKKLEPDVNAKELEAEEINITDEELQDSRVGRSGQWGDPTEPPVVEVSFEEILELQDELDENDTLMGDLRVTADTDGSTDNPELAWDQGLVYTPPFDPPVVPSDDLQNVEMAAGFATSIEEEPEIANLPPRVDDNDSDAEDDIRRALRYSAGTTSLDDVRVYVRNGIAYLRGTVLDDDDVALVEEVIRDLDIVDDIRNELETAY